MTLLAFALIVAAVVAMVVFLRREVKRAVADLKADIEARQALLDGQQKALYKQGKAQEKRAAQVTAAAARAVDRVNDLGNKNRVLHESVQTVLCDPRIQKALDEGGRARG